MKVQSPVKSNPVEVRFDKGRHHRAALGFVVLASEQTVESDVYKLAPEGVGVFFSRQSETGVGSASDLALLETGIDDTAALIVPYDDLDVACYTCNCATMVIGEETVTAAMRRGRSDAVPTTVMTNVVRGLKAVGAQRIVVATPYLDEVNDHVLNFLKDAGFEVLDLQGLNLTYDREMIRVDPQFLKEFVVSLDRPDADAVFVCCGALRTLDVVDEIEKQLGKPVVVSNQAMMWDCLRLAGIEDRIEGYGKLMTLPRLEEI
ncbi:Asp/Glu racemase [Rhodobacteraceae bacterium KLH11]|nr:Asp/Glu racemase [Rhodobacteraceae bacterium KLH11]